MHKPSRKAVPAVVICFGPSTIARAQRLRVRIGMNACCTWLSTTCTFYIKHKCVCTHLSLSATRYTVRAYAQETCIRPSGGPGVCVIYKRSSYRWSVYVLLRIGCAFTLMHHELNTVNMVLYQNVTNITTKEPTLQGLLKKTFKKKKTHNKANEKKGK